MSSLDDLYPRIRKYIERERKGLIFFSIFYVRGALHGIVTYSQSEMFAIIPHFIDEVIKT